MAILKNRLTSTQDLILVFSVCAFPIYAWSVINMLHKVPAWVKQFRTWDLIGIIAYNQVFALIETIIVFFLLILLGAILPARYFRDNFAAQANMVILFSTASVIFAHFNNFILPYLGQRREFAFAVYMSSIGLFYVASIGVFNALIRRHQKLEELIRSFGNRVMPLSSILVVTSLLGLIIIVLRNVFR